MVGENANRQHAPGGGSAEIKALYEITPLLGIQMLLGGNTEVVYKPGYHNEDVGNIWANTGDSENGQADSLNQESRTAQAAPEEKINARERSTKRTGRMRSRRQKMPMRSSLWAV